MLRKIWTQAEVCERLGCSLDELDLRDVYNGLSIQTDQGTFGITQRDGGIEVLLDGKLVWSSMSMEGEDESCV